MEPIDHWAEIPRGSKFLLGQEVYQIRGWLDAPPRAVAMKVETGNDSITIPLDEKLLAAVNQYRDVASLILAFETIGKAFEDESWG